MKKSIPYKPITLAEKITIVEIFRAAYRRKLARESQDGKGSELPETASPKAKFKKV
jgi:hypothetical protein